MNPKQTTLLLAALAAAVTFTAAACGTEIASAEGAGDTARGRYLVESVAMCQDCHSPRDEKGGFLPDRWLTGAPLPFAPTVPMPWAQAAPSIAGLPTLTDEQAMTFLTTGELPGGRRPLPPMPGYRFPAGDARAIVAYLRAPTPPTSPGPAPAAER